ncbi:hypothetical protein JOC95_001036 [Bacillus tianshenii]|uniref:DUF4129 domain-containing protein n=1 Tax=Sutcliffiella tianshenii TaxID=1463404 RepID=A0ABS2NXJ9_9BACI|nr:DUF4129 domain-containing protein [Bacillus tianshenii]MBM7619187.1 hypothetical protein [Bacillus tianshenii]
MKEEKAREDLKEILSREEYQIYYKDNRNTLQVFWDDLKAWLAEMLAKFFPSMEATSSVAGNILIVVISVAIAILLIIFIFFAVRYRQRRIVGKQQPFRSSNELQWSYQEHLKQAKIQEELNDYSLSTRHLFLALLLYFHEKNWLEARIWKTNWEYYEELRTAKEESAELFFNFALLFDRATYGKQQILKDEYSLYRDKALKWLEEEDV